MCLLMLHDKVRSLGMGAMYEGHLANGAFRDLFNERSTEWGSTPMAQKIIDLRGFTAAGITIAEMVGHYRETWAKSTVGGGDPMPGLVGAARAYRAAGFAPPFPPDVEAALGVQA